MNTTSQKTHIEELWGDIVQIVDGMVHDKEETGVHTGVTGKPKEVVKVVEPNSKEEVQELERKTMLMLEEIISLMYFGLDLTDAEMRSDSSFLAKLSTRLHRKVTLTVDVPMAVGMKENDRNVYLLINPIRLRYTVKTVGEIIAIVRHELYHILYNHLGESKGYPRDKTTQYVLNIAQDCEINQSRLIRTHLPEGAISLDYVREVSGKPHLESEAGYVTYYKALMDSPEYQDMLNKMGMGDDEETKVYVKLGNGVGDDDEGGENEGEGSKGELGEGAEGNGGQSYKESSSDLSELVGKNSHASWGDEGISQDTAEKVINGIVRDTYNSLTDKERGLLSQRIMGQISKLDHTPDVDWRDKIRRQHGKMKSQNKRKTLNRPNRRFPNRLDLKGKLPDYDIKIVMALDVSGSVSDGALEYTMGEGYHLSRELNAPLTLLQIDSDLLSEQEIKKPSDFNNILLNGRGGTRFQPAFDYLANKGLTDTKALLVYVTDGFGESEEYLNRHGFNNVLWLLVDTDKEDVLSCDGKGRVELLNNDKKYN